MNKLPFADLRNAALPRRGNPPPDVSRNAANDFTPRNQTVAPYSPACP